LGDDLGIVMPLKNVCEEEEEDSPYRERKREFLLGTDVVSIGIPFLYQRK